MEDFKWPYDSDHALSNVWYSDAAQFVKIVQDNGGFWPLNPNMKYIDIRIDTRTGHFVLRDGQHNDITPDDVMAVIQEWKDK